MAQTGYTPISLYYSTTASQAPSAGNLANGELAINITDGKLYYKDNLGAVKVIAGSGGTGIVAGSNTQVQFNNNGVFGASANLTFNGTTLTAGGLTTSGTTSTGVLSVTGNTTLGDASADSVTVNGTITSNLLFTDNTYDIGASGATRPRNLYLANSAVVGGSITTPTITVNLPTASDAASIKGSASGSANLLLQSSAGSGVAYWLSAKTGGTLAIGGNGSTEPSLGAINIGSTGLIGIGATSNYPLGIQKNGVQVGTTNAYIIVSARDGTPNKGVSLAYDNTSQTGIVLGDSNGPASALAFWTYNTDGTGWAETARFTTGRSLTIGTASANGKITAYNGQVGGLATTLSPVSTIWMNYANAVGDNRGAGPSFVFAQGITPDDLLKSAAIGAPSADSGGLSRIVDLSFWTSAFDANRAEVGRFTGTGGNFLVGKTAGYNVNEANTIQAKGAIVWAADNTASANNRNWLALVNGSSNGSWDLVNSGANNTWPNNAYILSITQSEAVFPRSDVILSNIQGNTRNFFRAYEVGGAGQNSGLSMGNGGVKGSIYGASGLQGMRIVGGSNTIFFGGFDGDTSVYNNYNSFGIWNTTGLGIGNTNPQYKLDVVDSARIRGDTATFWMDSTYSTGQSWRWIVPNNTYGAPTGSLALYSDTQGAYRLVMKNNGNLGLGLTDPQQKLDINGAVRFTPNTSDTNYTATIYANYNSSHPFQIDVKNNGTTFEMWGMYASPGGGSERISSPTLDVAVGTTDTTGSLSNNKAVVAGRFKTFDGSVVQTGGGAWYDAFTISQPGLYILHAYIGGYNAGPSDWSNAWYISFTGGNNMFVSPSALGAAGNIQAQRKPGTPQTLQLYLGGGVGITYSYQLLRIS